MFDELMHLLGFGLCHQLPERSLFGGAHQLPVCARDTGIYVGFALSILLISLLERRRRPSEMPPWPLIVAGVGFVVAMGVDAVTSYAGVRETTNTLRVLTGTMTGFALTLAIVPILNGQLWRRPGNGRLLAAPWKVAVWLGAVVLSFPLMRYVLPLTGFVYPILASLAILFTFTATNLAVVSLLPPFERRAERLRDAWLAILIALGFTAVELVAAGMLRSFLESLAS